MRVRFWGVRGSVPYATAGSIGHGCNTPCLEVTDEQSGRRLILDAGSGIVGVGDALGGVLEIPIVLTHYHWDHIQGLPFFAPLYRAGAAVTVWAPSLGREVRRYRSDVRVAVFSGALRSAALTAVDSRESRRPCQINGFDVSAEALNHPGGALRVSHQGS